VVIYWRCHGRGARSDLGPQARRAQRFGDEARVGVLAARRIQHHHFLQLVLEYLSLGRGSP
jgi:hypothetical protein